MTDPLIGQEIDGFRILEELGRGGMGVVYKAEDVALARTVALKMIARDLASDETFVRRFRSEARALARINSPHITGIYALRRTESALFIVMEYIGGGTLGDRMALGPLPWDEIKSVVVEMIAALEHAHGVGVIHRDIKPGNILINEAGHVKVTDFGLAKLHENEAGATVTKGIAGTLHYMSPEQVKGERDLDARSDLYSLGMTIYEALTGRLPFERGASEFSTMRTIVEDPYPPPEEFSQNLPPGLGAAVMKALAKDRDVRYTNAAAMRAAFDAIPGASGAARVSPVDVQTVADAAPYRPAAPAPAPASPGAKRGLLLGVGGLALLALAALAFWLWPHPATVPLTVVTDPPGASVYIDGASAGTTPVEAFEVEGTTARVRVERPGFLPLDTLLTFAGAAPTTLRLSLRDAGPPLPTINVTSEPTGADVLVDGERVGTTPYSYQDTSAAPVTVRVEHQGFRAWSQRDVTPDADSPPALHATLRPASAVSPSAPPSTPPSMPPESRPAATSSAPGTVVLTADPGGTVSVAGQSGSGSGTFQVPAGNQTVRCENPQYGTFETSVRVQAAQTTTATCHFLTRVNVQTTTASGPTWGAVWIDGQNSGETTPTVLTLGPGTYRIEIRRDGYTVNDPPRTVTVAAGLESKTERIVFTMQKE